MPFDRSQLRLIEPLRAMRMVHFSAWLARRWEDPAFPVAFPAFGTSSYWAREAAQLGEQLRLVLSDAS
jgi:Ser/Thr protein kinase RdoA (MazF antagonist)